MDIHKGFGNANVILGRILYKALDKENIQLISIDGGGLRNAIPREAVAIVSVRNAQEFIEEVTNGLKKEIIEGVDIQIFRELVSGIYFGEKFTDDEAGYAYDVCKYNRDEIAPIVHMAFQEAQKRRKKLTLIDKANVLDTSRLWRKVYKEIAQEYPDVELDFMFVDNAAMQLILNPKQFDVIVTENMFGDIISDEASVIGGSIGLLPSASIGNENALFEPIHGSYPQAKGKGIANPVASVLSTAMMLDYLGLGQAAEKLRQSVEYAIENKYVTVDLNAEQHYSTNEVGSFIADYIKYSEKSYYNFENVKIGKSTIV